MWVTALAPWSWGSIGMKPMRFRRLQSSGGCSQKFEERKASSFEQPVTFFNGELRPLERRFETGLPRLAVPPHTWRWNPFPRQAGEHMKMPRIFVAPPMILQQPFLSLVSTELAILRLKTQRWRSFLLLVQPGKCRDRADMPLPSSPISWDGRISILCSIPQVSPSCMSRSC